MTARASEKDRPAAVPWTIKRVLAWASEDLRARSVTSPRLDAEVLLAHVLGVDRVALVIDSERPLSSEELARYRELHQRRRAGEPVAYLRGRREFYGRSFRVDARVLVPRPDTEILVEVALARTRHLSMCARVLDLCTGSGCVAVTLACERPTTKVVALDISEEALEVTHDNAHRLGAIANLACMKSDLYAALDPGARFDLITANPPYIPEDEVLALPKDIRDFEPRVALVGGHDGLATLRRVIEGAPAHLESAGMVAVEVGAGQADAVARLFQASGFRDVETARDYGGHERVVSGALS